LEKVRRELVLASGKPLKRLAAELGVCDVTSRDWRDWHLAKTEPIETDGKKLSAHPLAQEPRRVQKELHIAKRRNEILKKSLGHFFGRPAAERFALMKTLASQYPVTDLFAVCPTPASCKAIRSVFIRG
jgi:transposase-like protein